MYEIKPDRILNLRDNCRIFAKRNIETLKLYVRILIDLYNEYQEWYSLPEERCVATIQKVLEDFAAEPEEDDEIELTEHTVENTYGRPGKYLDTLVTTRWLRKEYDVRTMIMYYSFPLESRQMIKMIKKSVLPTDDVSRGGMSHAYNQLKGICSGIENGESLAKETLDDIADIFAEINDNLTLMGDEMKQDFTRLSKAETYSDIQREIYESIESKVNKRYSILTTRDNFYIYKSKIPGMLNMIGDHLEQREDTLEEQKKAEKISESDYIRYRNLIQHHATNLEHIKHEFLKTGHIYDQLSTQKRAYTERAANKLRFQKRYGSETSSIGRLIHVLTTSDKKDEIIEKIGECIAFSKMSSQINEVGFFQPKEKKEKIIPVEKVLEVVNEPAELEKPLFSEKELRDFREKNSKNGRFYAKGAVKTDIDMEKALLLLLRAGENSKLLDGITIGEEVESNGFIYNDFSF